MGTAAIRPVDLWRRVVFSDAESRRPASLTGSLSIRFHQSPCGFVLLPDLEYKGGLKDLEHKSKVFRSVQITRSSLMHAGNA
jgi:hypothetical protein